MTFFALASSFVPTLPDGLFGSRAVMPNGYADRRPGPPPASLKGDSRAPSPKPRAQSPGSAGIQLLGPSCAPILPTLLSGRCLVAGFKAPNNPLCPPFPRSSRTSAHHRAEVLVCAAEGSPHKSFWAYGAGCHRFLWTVAVFRAPMSDPGLREISGGSWDLGEICRLWSTVFVVAVCPAAAACATTGSRLTPQQVPILFPGLPDRGGVHP